MNAIYLDNNSTTPMLPEVWEAMQPYFTQHAGNPSSSHQFGRQARRALEDAREEIAALLNSHPDEVVFTSGATEANNLAIFGLAGTTPGVIATSMIEHPSVVEPIHTLTLQGFERVRLPVTETGEVKPGSWRDDARLVAVMLANHETGAIQPIEPLAQMLEHRAPFHCDAAAAAGKIPISFRRLSVTSLTVSAHKFHGPKGIGALLLCRPIKLRPLFFGGHQQQGKRPGTEAVALAVGMAKALALAVERMETNHAKVLTLRARFLELLRAAASPVALNGPPERGGIPGTINLSFPGCQADALLMSLDLAGVAASTGSACSSGSLLPSPVLTAMGVSDERLRSAMRFSLSALLSEADIDEAARRIARCVAKLRAAPNE